MVVVTGASGFLGRYVVRALREAFPTEALRAFDLHPPEQPFQDGVETIQGSVEDAASVAAAATGSRAIIHLAASVQPNSRAFDKMWRINVDGTRNVHSAAVAAGCATLLHLSSAGIYGHPCKAEPFREDETPQPLTPYQVTKWESEQALRGADSNGTVVNILRPAGIYGAGSLLELAAYRRVQRMRLSIEMSGSVIVHPTNARDVALALVAMVTNPAPHGTVFNLGGDRPIRLLDFEALVAESMGVRRLRITLPSAMVGPAMAVIDPLLNALGRRNALRRGLSCGQVFSAAVDDRRFRTAYPHVPVVKTRDGVREHLDWAYAKRLLTR